MLVDSECTMVYVLSMRGCLLSLNITDAASPNKYTTTYSGIDIKAQRNHFFVFDRSLFEPKR